MLYWYKSTNTDAAHRLSKFGWLVNLRGSVFRCSKFSTQIFLRFPSTKAQILTQPGRRRLQLSVPVIYWQLLWMLGFALLYALLALYWYRSTNTDAHSIQRALDLLAAAVDAQLRPPGCCFTSAKVQILTQPGDVFVPLYYSVPFIYWQFLWMLGFALMYAWAAGPTKPNRY